MKHVYETGEFSDRRELFYTFILYTYISTTTHVIFSYIKY